MPLPAYMIMALIAAFFFTAALYNFVLLYIRAVSNDRSTRAKASYRRYIREKFDSIVDSPSENSMIDEIRQLRDYVGTSRYHFDTLSEMFFNFLNVLEPGNEHAERALFKLLEILKPAAFYAKLLNTGSQYDKAHACRMLAEFAAYDQIKNIEKYLNSKNSELSYNAAMALAKLGDQEGVSSFVIGCKDNFKISRRVILQLLGEYNEDIKALARMVLKECDEYTRANVIKALAKYKYTDFEEEYLESAKSRNATLRVAAVTAIGNFADAKYEQQLVSAAHDRVWIVRNAAVKALGRLNTPKALEVVSRATSDGEWWVRYNAAKTLITMQGGMGAAEDILEKFDDYASDAIRYVLSRDVSY